MADYDLAIIGGGRTDSSARLLVEAAANGRFL
jgi:hypothetical protein